jgi:tubulin--tyrosine ligase
MCFWVVLQWQVFGEINRQLLGTAPWVSDNGDDGGSSFDLLLADRGRVDWPKLASVAALHKLKTGRAMAVNYFRGYNQLTNKSELCRSMKAFAAEEKSDFAGFIPEAYVVRPMKPSGALESDDERTAFLDTFDSNKQNQTRNIWIVKSNKGAKGSNILVSEQHDEILAFVDAQRIEKKQKEGEGKEKELSGSATSRGLKPWLASKRTKKQASWIIQRYIADPFLFKGRKFDMRVWVLLTHDYRMYICKQFVCRLSAVEYSLANLNDKYAHITNHCVQADHPDFNGNEVFTAEFDAYLQQQGKSVAGDLFPQLASIVRCSLRSTQELMAVSPSLDYKCFQLFGYDFLLDADFNCHLLEVNATPAFAEWCLSAGVQGIIDLGIRPFFPHTAPQAQPPEAGFAWTRVDEEE